MAVAGQPESSVRYRAFISYSHADSGFARWLHRRIEGFSLPSAPGEARVRLAPVFLDRAELPAATDLSATVRAALAESAALVVVASPSARSSRWVDREIALFRELHPDRPILAALIDGAPDEAFPPALTGDGPDRIEPLAADFRKGADGRRLGLLKIVAGLSAQPLDRLVQRDAQSRQRRVMAVTAGALLLSLVLAGLLVVAMQARAEAERQRASAEGMVEFMLTDLRDKLKGVGRLDVMDAVNARAMAHYSAQSLEDLPVESLTRRARLLHSLGEDASRRGNLAKASALYAEASRTTAAVLAQQPDDPEAIFAHAQSEFWVGSAAWAEGNLALTERHWRGYLTQAEALARREPGSLRSLMELGYAHGNLCELTNRKTRDPLQALPWCERATGFMRQATARNDATSQIRLDLANRIGWQADVLRQAGKTDAALALRAEEAAIIGELLAADPANRELAERSLWPELGAGEAELKAGRGEAALARLQRTLADYGRLAADRPDDRALTVQQFRAAWLATRAAQLVGNGAGEDLLRQARSLHGLLRRSYSAAEMARFDKMLSQIEGGSNR
jgi:hypothetical protein